MIEWIEQRGKIINLFIQIHKMLIRNTLIFHDIILFKFFLFTMRRGIIYVYLVVINNSLTSYHDYDIILG